MYNSITQLNNYDGGWGGGLGGAGRWVGAHWAQDPPPAAGGGRISYFVFRISYFVYRISYIVYRISYNVYRITYIVFRISYNDIYIYISLYIFIYITSWLWSKLSTPLKLIDPIGQIYTTFFEQLLKNNTV